MKYTMNRDVTVSSKLGHSVAFVKGEPTFVPAEMAHEVLAAGGVPDDMDKVAFPDQGQKPAGTPTDPAARTGMIRLALADIAARNQREQFGANGTPKVKAVEHALGFEVTGKEINELWAEHNQANDPAKAGK